tara:strand:+ start:994 stop:2874 length:1881 start_codon:yes stop_codon:yes gene_type:complete
MAITKIEVPELFDFGSDNSAFKLPTGTTADRPTSPSNGEMRFNTTTGYVEYYDTTDTQWWEIDYETLCTTNDPNYPIANLAYYKMSDASDSSGNAYNGTATDVNFNVAGKFGNAGEFNGTSSYISTGINVSTTLMTSRSYSFWFKQNSNTNVSRIFGGANAGVTNNGMFRIREDNGTINYYSINNGVYTWTTTLTNDVWTHVALTDTGSLAKLYIDGAEIASPSTSTFTTTTNTNLQIGRGRANSGSITNYANGTIDQVRIFDSALNATQVTQLYNEIQCVPTIVPSENFNTVLYTGNDTNTSYTRDITGVGFDPDFVWIKDRDNSNFEHALFDSVRGAGASKILSSDSTGAEGWTTAAPMSAFITDGFSVQPRSPWNANNLVNKNGEDFVAWSWKAGGAAVSNTDGTVTSQVSANVDAGFSIVTNTSPTGAYTWGHGLSKAPELWIHKATNYTYGWETMYPDEFGQATGSNNPSDWNRIFLNTTAATTTNPFYSATDTVLSITGWGLVSNFVTYCFHSVDGFSKIGSYVGNGSTTGPIITLGFEPAWIMFKPTTATGYWYILDNKRSTTNPRNDGLFPNDSLNEITNTSYNVDFNSDGFQPKNNTIGFNQNGQTYIFMAFAADPT